MITKEKFVEILSAIEKQFEYDDKCHNAFSVILKNDYVSGYDYSLVFNSLIDLLRNQLNDKGDWINYFIWDLKFGKNYKSGMIKDKNKNDIDLSNKENLYIFLIENFSKN